MRSNYASAARTCCGTLLLVSMASLLPQLSAQDRICKAQSLPVSAEAWSKIPPPRDGVTVAFYDDGPVWVGLNHIYADSQSLTHRWRTFIPWMSPGIASVFPLRGAFQSPATRMPVFYVSRSAAALDAYDPNAQRIHLVRADRNHNERKVQITSGWSVFSFHPGFTAREEVPLKFDVLSRTVYAIQPKRPLEDGEYLVVFGPSAASGFEFQIGCSGTKSE